jgi:hypothetical protein
MRWSHINKKVMPFVMEIKKKVIEDGPSIFKRELKFDEISVLNENLQFFCRTLSIIKIEVVDLSLSSKKCDGDASQKAVPGNPTCGFSMMNKQKL